MSQVEKCGRCKEYKSTLLFTRDRQQKNGLSSYCNECNRKKSFTYYKKNRERERAKAIIYGKKRRVSFLEKRKKLYKDLVTDVFNLLGNRCALCLNDDKRVLQVDHINGGGNIERKIKGTAYTHYKFMRESIEKNENKYRLLCANDNLLQAVIRGFKKSIWHEVK